MKKYLKFYFLLIPFLFFGCQTDETLLKVNGKSTSLDISKIDKSGFDFRKIDAMLAHQHVQESVDTFKLQMSSYNEIDKIDNVFVFIDKILSCIEKLPNPEQFDFSKTEIKYEDLKKQTKDSVFSWWDVFLIPVTLTADCLGGCGIATGSYLALRTSYEVMGGSNSSKDKAGERLSYKELEDFGIAKYENYKEGLKRLNNLINDLYSKSDIQDDEKIRLLKDKINIAKKELSLRRCNFISYTVLAPKLEIAYIFARLYDEQWWPKNEKLINNAFLALSNSGPLIQASNKDVRQYWLTEVLPELKKDISQKSFDDKSAMLSLVGDGETGARYWLNWE